jgi:hypothetical protein
VFFEYSSGNINGNGFFNNGILTGISFEGDLDTTIGNLIEQNGPPDFVINVPIISGSNVITFIYKERGISYSYGTTDLSKKMSENLEPEIPIEYILLFDPGKYDQMVESGLFGQGHLTGEQTLKYLVPWSGYGLIQFKYPPAKR